MSKSVDKIVKSLDRLVTQLQVCIISCGVEAESQRLISLGAQVRLSNAKIEQDRAMRIRDKIKELIK